MTNYLPTQKDTFDKHETVISYYKKDVVIKNII